jgi:hypothetical protein
MMEWRKCKPVRPEPVEGQGQHRTKCRLEAGGPSLLDPLPQRR